MIGELIGGRYRLERELGRGGFGTVFVAVQEDMGRRVALKMLHRRHLEGVGVDRFRREAQLAHRLSHPNTVRLFEFGVHDGMPFIVFELLAGESLASLLHRAGPLPPARTVHITRQILKSLMEAHEQGIVHRDIKPANVFICTYAGEADFVKVLDFGIAKSVEAETASLTSTGEAVGTPSYMPPEQLSGGVLSPATDLYAVGLIMAEMTSGSRVMSGSAMEIAMRQLDQRPLVFPDAVCFSPLWPVIERATRKLAAYRYSSAAEMLGALEQAPAATPSFPAGPVSQAGSSSFTVPIGASAGPVSSTLLYTPAGAAPAKSSGGGIVKGLALLLLLGGGLAALAALGVAAYFFVDLDSLLGRTAGAGSTDAGASVVTASAADAGAVEPEPGASSTPVVGTPGRGASGKPLPSGPATALPSAAPTASTKTSGGATFGKPCTSSADCKGANEKCGQSGTCECASSGGGIGSPRACGGRCVSNTDPDNCGACGKRCANDEVCTTNMGGSVQSPICYQCTKGAYGSVRILCGPHQCVAPNTDPRHCGGCNKKCAPGQSCEGGVCK